MGLDAAHDGRLIPSPILLLLGQLQIGLKSLPGHAQLVLGRQPPIAFRQARLHGLHHATGLHGNLRTEKRPAQTLNPLTELESQIIKPPLNNRPVIIKNAILRPRSIGKHPGKLGIGLVPDAAQLHLLALHLAKIGNPGKRLGAPLKGLFGLLNGTTQHLPLVPVGGSCRCTRISLRRPQGRPSV
ncbi:hypothetical protein EAJ17_12270 [Akkermansia sp. aa_0143]|uniref:hypothetical protein n=1 Tax=unclassified Akkermansia TaxID=2608915 RepID=UPI0010E6A6C7|nr:MULTISPECIES: hypothetical protein [unclassified Akkermansia]KAA3151602.1 hypothetical protein F2A12_12225 [Akkermansia sp. BIOML-A65]KAA3165112.1 hypothetical protein F2A01_01045 [Akkermansia sp. BIOML-A60]KAA3168754.1 hypothetical protein F2A09_12015 [Akkermansia sp. BIOML-A57]KAA3202881.1 hypothetical protein F1987_03555 [Akkermansia sp. BIOML-A47]KAA3223046.1 hypothetical protein F1964_01945 [Akkermansia sp. BIOML-A38]KAA3238401.1 hypothetical protein F1971_11995 [Akkermansia sp. BIOML